MDIYVKIEITASSSFVDLMLLFWQRRRTFLEEIDFGRCFVDKNSVRPGQIVKWLHLIAKRNVYLIGLKAAPCRKSAGSNFVFREERAL